jgi:hypothetical protein
MSEPSSRDVPPRPRRGSDIPFAPTNSGTG